MNIDFTSLGKGIFGIGASGSFYVLGQAAQQVDGLPSWISSLGLPTAMLVTAIYALNKMHKALADSQEARIADKVKELAAAREDVERSIKTREELTTATREQTEEFRRLSGHLMKQSYAVRKVEVTNDDEHRIPVNPE